MKNQALYNSIKNDKDSCFTIEYVFEFDESLYEKLDDCDSHEFRVIFCEDDYDYVEDEELIQKLRIAYLATR